MLKSREHYWQLATENFQDLLVSVVFLRLAYVTLLVGDAVITPVWEILMSSRQSLEKTRSFLMIMKLQYTVPAICTVASSGTLAIRLSLKNNTRLEFS